MSESPMHSAQDGRRRRLRILLPWHIVLGTAFLLAFLTGDDSSFGRVHLYAGYVVIAALAVRVLAGLGGGPLALPRPSVAALFAKRSERRGRHPALGWMATILLLALPAAAASGFPAAASRTAADLHGQLSDLAAVLVTVHAAIVIAIFAG